jgi:acyl carrier protein phosphodiesterase
MVGNMISDFVKGRKKFDYPSDIQVGIALHRIIDMYTDEHASTKKAKEVFRPAYRLYSGAFIDIVYDHFLANEPTEFNKTSLALFSTKVYDVLSQYSRWLPPSFAGMLIYMKAQDWLYNYQFDRGIAKSFSGLVRRASYLKESETAFQLFNSNYQLLQECFRQFWADIKPFARGQLEILTRGAL